MTKEDRQIIKRATKETWRIGDRSRLKRLLEKNLKLFRENVELKERLTFARAVFQKQYKENAELKSEKGCETCTKFDEVKLTKAKEILREYIRINLLPPIERNFDDEVKLFKQAEQFLKEIEEND